MNYQGNWKETSIFVYDDLFPLQAKLTRNLRSKDDVRGFLEKGNLSWSDQLISS